MSDLVRKSISGRGIAVRGNDIDTDRIIPARYLRCVTFEGLGEHAFEDDRAQNAERGIVHPFDDPRFAGASILIVNQNFGCGSSREHAPQAIMRWGKGIRAIVGESFAEIFFGNCVALGVPCLQADRATVEALMALAESTPENEFDIDLETMQILAGGTSYTVALADGPRTQFIEGTWDTTGELLAGTAAIAATAANLPYVNHWK